MSGTANHNWLLINHRRQQLRIRCQLPLEPTDRRHSAGNLWCTGGTSPRFCTQPPPPQVEVGRRPPTGGWGGVWGGGVSRRLDWIGLDWCFALYGRAIPGSQVPRPTGPVTFACERPLHAQGPEAGIPYPPSRGPSRPPTHTAEALSRAGAPHTLEGPIAGAPRTLQGPQSAPNAHYKGPESVPHTPCRGPEPVPHTHCSSRTAVPSTSLARATGQRKQHGGHHSSGSSLCEEASLWDEAP